MAQPSATTSKNTADTAIDGVIQQVERLYAAITGKEAPRQKNGPYAPIPPEVDAAAHVESKMSQMLQLLGAPGAGTTPAPSWTPAASVFEAGDELVIEFDVPGVPRDSIQVAVSGRVATISGSRPGGRSPGALAPESEGSVLLSERRFGAFARSIPLPSGISEKQIAATLRDGVLTLRAPRSSASEATRAIPIG